MAGGGRHRGRQGAGTEAACPQLQALQSQLEFLEQSMVDKSLVSRQEAKIRELETRLEFERTQVKRLEVGTGTPLTGTGWVRHIPSPHGAATAMEPRHEETPGVPWGHPRCPHPRTPHAAAVLPAPPGKPPRALITVIRHPAWQSAAISLHRLSEIIDSPGPAKRSLLYILPLQLSAEGAEQLSSPLNIFLAVISLPALSAGAINMQRLAQRLVENGSYFFPTLHAVITSHKVKSIFPIHQSPCSCSTPSLAWGGGGSPGDAALPPASFPSPHVNSWGRDPSSCEPSGRVAQHPC